MNPSPYSKEAQLARSPGGNRHKKAAKAGATKGSDLEKAVAKAFNGRRNHQGRSGGGIQNPDVSAMREWSIEVKNTATLEIPKWTRNLLSETPKGKRPGLVYVLDDTPWISIRLEDRVNFASDLIESAGGEVTF